MQSLDRRGRPPHSRRQSHLIKCPRGECPQALRGPTVSEHVLQPQALEDNHDIEATIVTRAAPAQKDMASQPRIAAPRSRPKRTDSADSADGRSKCTDSALDDAAAVDEAAAVNEAAAVKAGAAVIPARSLGDSLGSNVARRRSRRGHACWAVWLVFNDRRFGWLNVFLPQDN